MMEPTRTLLRALAAVRAAPCVSIYMPAWTPGADPRQEPIRLKNLLREAEEKLVANGVRAEDAERLLGPARDLAREDALSERRRARGAALFLAPGTLHRFELPVDVPEVVRVGSTFYLKPLAELFLLDDRFFVLALSQHEVRLLEAAPAGVREVDLGPVPRTLEAFLGLDDDPQHARQANTGVRARGDRLSVSGGAAREDLKSDLLRFFRQVDRAVRDAVAETRAPLVLAAVDYEAAIYREANTYEQLAAAHVPGNPETVRPEVLRDRAREVLAPVLAKRLDDAIARFRRHGGSSRTSSHIVDVVTAAAQGRVDVLFIRRGAERWGAAPGEDGATEVHEQPAPGDVDLIDYAVLATISHGGTVYALDRARFPGSGEVAALFRY
jgi:hypothetical protein